MYITQQFNPASLLAQCPEPLLSLAYSGSVSKPPPAPRLIYMGGFSLADNQLIDNSSAQTIFGWAVFFGSVSAAQLNSSVSAKDSNVLSRAAYIVLFCIRAGLS